MAKAIHLKFPGINFEQGLKRLAQTAPPAAKPARKPAKSPRRKK